jgi:hypothetical protein
MKEKKKPTGYGSWKVDKFAFSFNYMFREVYNVDSLLRSCVNEAAQLVINEIKGIIVSALSLEGYKHTSEWIGSFGSRNRKPKEVERPHKVSQLLVTIHELNDIIYTLDRNFPKFLNDFDLQEIRRKIREWYSLIELLESQDNNMTTPLPFLM